MDNAGITPLHIAVIEGKKIMVELLGQNGAAVYRKEYILGRTPLDSATKNGNKEIIKILKAATP
jgi:ankyrin repeat protein